jgi:capsular exopolysaccharide synthesis family protein
MQFYWDRSFTIQGKLFSLSHNRPIQNVAGKYMISWIPVKQAAQVMENKLSVDVLDKKTSIIKLEILSENLKRGQDILNAVYREFELSYLEEKNAISEKTASFINDRLAVVSNELSGVEGNLENYRGNNEIVNVTSQSALSFENESDVSKSITDIMVQQGVVKMIQDYFNNVDTKGKKLVPSSLGINDPTLASLIVNYNEVQLQKERMAPTQAPNSLILKDLNNQLNDLRGSILENLQNITKNLQFQQNKLTQKNAQYKQFLSALPHKERVMQEIKRKQSITEGLYLYLLQKREENSISASSSNVSIYKQIDEAKGYGPVSPNKTNIQLYSIAFGLLIPIGIIRLRDMMNDKIMRKSDITSRTKIPVIGELSHIRSKHPGIVVQSRNFIAEQFRLLRTNISFIGESGKSQVILTTSSVINEGKSLISFNLAAVLAAPGNKVALLEFDMRMPALFNMIGKSNKTGLSEYLGGEITSADEIKYEMEDMKNLHIYPAGKTPVNVADLLLSEKLPAFIETLKQQYQYIVIDTAPVGLVTDAFILGRYADIVLYVIRQDHTLKRQLENLNEIYKTGKFFNLCIVFNDIRAGAKYGPGYGNHKAYDYSYGKTGKHGFSFHKRNGYNKKLAV